MAVEVSSYVWQHTEYKGSQLLVLLALADWSNPEGVCWPSVDTIAQRTRMTKRNAQIILSKLEDAGEIKRNVGQGAKTQKGATNQYIMTGFLNHKQGAKSDSSHESEGVKADSPHKPEGVKPDSSLGVKPDSSKPSLEPSVKREPSVSTRVRAEASQPTQTKRTVATAKQHPLWFAYTQAYADLKRMDIPAAQGGAKALWSAIDMLQDAGATPDVVTYCVKRRLKDRHKPLLFRYVAEDYDHDAEAAHKRQYESEREYLRKLQSGELDNPNPPPTPQDILNEKIERLRREALGISA